MSFLVFLPLGPQILSEPVSIAYEVCVCVCVCVCVFTYPMNFEGGRDNGGSGCS
jgi:hypothetical protein